MKAHITTATAKSLAETGAGLLEEDGGDEEYRQSDMDVWQN